MIIRNSVLILAALLANPAAAQDDAAAQRAEIANQRIQAEIEMRRRAEEATRAAEQQAVEEQPVESTAVASSAPARRSTVPSSTPPKSRADMSQSLQQIRTLGELRDAGYVTEDEFQRIKERILESTL